MGRESLSEIKWGRIRLAIEAMTDVELGTAINDKRINKLLAKAVYPNQKHPRRLDRSVVDEAVKMWGAFTKKESKE